MKICNIMDNQIAHILKQHIQWKDSCIDSLENDEFTNTWLDSTKNVMIKMFQRDKFFLELYLRALLPHKELLTKNPLTNENYC